MRGSAKAKGLVSNAGLEPAAPRLAVSRAPALPCLSGEDKVKAGRWAPAREGLPGAESGAGQSLRKLPLCGMGQCWLPSTCQAQADAGSITPFTHEESQARGRK